MTLTITPATQLVSQILGSSLHKTDEISTFTLQGCRFSLSHGQIGHNHDLIGWYLVHDFNEYDVLEAEGNIQWVLDEYGQVFTFEILDMVEYLHEELGCGFSNPHKTSDGRFIGTCSFREQTLDLEKEGVIKILSVLPRA